MQHLQRRVADNLAGILRRMAEAAERSGRDPGSVRLVAVSKHRSIEETDALMEAGQMLLGENRVQELLKKHEHYGKLPEAERPDWHFIGHLQRNKARQVVDKVALLHGADSVRLLGTLQSAAEKRDCQVKLLLEVNVSGEEAKYGFAPNELQAACDALEGLDRLHCRGLMTMAPFSEDPEAARPVFRELRELFETWKRRDLAWMRMEELSMGMSNDFEVAVEEGATLARVGTALFE